MYGRSSYARAGVEVHERLDDSIAVYYQGQCLAIKPAPLEAPALRARNASSVIFGTAYPYDVPVTPDVAAGETIQQGFPRPAKSGHDHPWRRPFKVHIDSG